MKPVEDQKEFIEKITAFLHAHNRVLADFGRSLANSAHFLKLAGKSMEQEPEETGAMLEQIKEIDLVGHLSRQHEEYQGVSGFLLPPNPPLTNPDLLGEISELHSKYEGLLEEAEGQMEQLDKLLFTLQNYH